jgi:hypothetical protein
MTIPTFSGSIFSSTVIAAAELLFQDFALKKQFWGILFQILVQTKIAPDR